jgi:hypothetical protein
MIIYFLNENENDHSNINCTLKGFWVFYLEINLIED